MNAEELTIITNAIENLGESGFYAFITYLVISLLKTIIVATIFIVVPYFAIRAISAHISAVAIFRRLYREATGDGHYGVITESEINRVSKIIQINRTKE